MLLCDWKTLICLVVNLGHSSPALPINRRRRPFFSLRQIGLAWPSSAGQDPIAAMVRDGRTHLVLTIHKVSDVIDGGEFFARSHPVAIPDGINVVGMHRITWPQMGPFIRQSVGTMLDTAAIMPASAPLVLQETAVPYGAGSRWTWPESIAA